MHGHDEKEIFVLFPFLVFESRLIDTLDLISVACFHIKKKENNIK